VLYPALFVLAAGVIDHIEVTPDPLDGKVGDETQLFPVAYDSDGVAIETRTFHWESSNTDVVVVDDTGFVWLRADGAATVTAAVEDVEGSTNVTVAEPAPDESCSAGGGSGLAMVALGAGFVIRRRR
jgi:MYXO-CTERM domain-containing protein